MKENLLYKAIIKSVTGKVGLYAVQFLCLIIYSRLFSPLEFGILASIQVFVIFFNMLSDVGIGPAMINEKKISTKQRDGIFTVTILVGVFLSILFYFFLDFINYFYESFDYRSIGYLICISIFFSAISIVPATSFNKDAKFLHISFVEISAELVSLVVVYYFSLKVGSVFALASKPMLYNIMRFLLLYLLSTMTTIGRVSVGKEIWHIKKILSFSLYQFYFNFVNYFSRNLDNILIAKYFGLNLVGVYDRSYQLMRYPLMLTTFAITPAIQPILNKNRGDLKKIQESHQDLAVKILLVTIPISTFLYSFPLEVVTLLLGKQWVEVAPILKILALTIPIQSIISISGSFFQVMNKPKLLFISGCVSAVVFISCIVIGVLTKDLVMVAYMLLVAFILNFFQVHFVLFKFCLGFPPKSTWGSLFYTIWTLIFWSVLYIYIVKYFEFSFFSNYLFFKILINMIIMILSLLPILYFIFYRFKSIKVSL